MIETVASQSVPECHPLDRLRVEVVARRSLTPRVEEFVLAPIDADHLPQWAPGAHVDVGLDGGRVRQYSLVSDPADLRTYSVAIELTRSGRGGSAAAHRSLLPGSRTWISFPRNHFPLRRALGYRFVAGGIGITPFVALLAAVDRSGRSWHLHYTARTREDMAYADELLRAYPGRVTLNESSSDGRMVPRDILAGVARGTAVYVCGPDGLVRDVEDACSLLPAVDAFSERFANSAQTGGTDSAFEVTLALSGACVTVPGGTSLLECLEAAGVVVPSSCRDGACGTCETGVVSGEVDHRDSVLSPEERAENESMMVCVSRGKAGRLVLEL